MPGALRAVSTVRRVRGSPAGPSIRVVPGTAHDRTRANGMRPNPTLTGTRDLAQGRVVSAFPLMAKGEGVEGSSPKAG
jgi:hypothetical protein